MIALVMMCDRCGNTTPLHGSVTHARADAEARGWSVASYAVAAPAFDYCGPECEREGRQCAVDAESREGEGAL